MKCPCCGNEMESGVVQSARTIFFTTKEHKNWFLPDGANREEVNLSSNNCLHVCIEFYHPVKYALSERRKKVVIRKII